MAGGCSKLRPPSDVVDAQERGSANFHLRDEITIMVRQRPRPTKLAAIAFCAAFLFESAQAGDQTPDLRSKSYDAARALLLKSGFGPVALKHHSDDYFCEDGFCKRYPEALNCAGTGLSPCQFVFSSKDKKGYFIVDTQGETRLTVSGSHWAQGYHKEDFEQRK